MRLGRPRIGRSAGLARTFAALLPLLTVGVVSGFLVTSGTQGAGPERVSTVSAPPGYNLVVISIDTLRADRLSLYGYDRPTSPTLEALADESLVLERFYATGGGTLASHMSMLTSLPPEVHGVLLKGQSLPPERTMLAEVLAAGGYRGAAFTGGGYTSAHFGFDQGFETYDDTGWGFDTALPKALDWIDASDDRPFFLFLHTYDVHSTAAGQPYDCPGGFADLYTAGYGGEFDGCLDGRCASKLLVWLNDELRTNEGFDLTAHLSPAEIEFLSSRYDGCINYADSKLGELVRHLRSRGLWDETLLVVTTDHGEEFMDHGLLLHMQGGYEEMAHLPLLLKLPGSELGGTRFEGLASMIDLSPSILSVLGFEPPPEMLGRDLLPIVRGLAPARDQVDILGTIRSARWKLIPHEDGNLLFDLANDPGETRNVAEQHPDRAARLRARSRWNRQRYEEFKSLLEAKDQVGREEVELSADQIERLRALGYLD